MSNYHMRKWFSVSFFAIEMKKIKVKMNKPIHLGFSILVISKTLMYQSWYDYMKPKYKEKAKLCYRNWKEFGLEIGLIKEIGLMRHELGGKNMNEFVGL